MKIFFLGGTSYLGKEIIKRLLVRSDHEISVYVRSPDSAAKLEGLKVQKIKDLSNIPKQDVVFNLVVDYGKNKDLSEVMATNVDFPLTVLNKIEFNSIINFSSGLDKDVSHYAYSKKSLEDTLVKKGEEKNFQVINLWLQHFYGPNAPLHNFVTFLISKMLNNEELPLTDCQQRRDFIFTEDVLDAVEVILKKLSQLSKNEILEVGYGESVKLQDFVEEIKRVSLSSSKLNFGAVLRRPNEPLELVANINKMKNLGWTPKTTVSEGILKTINQYRNNKSVK